MSGDVREAQARAQEPATPICEVCEVDHNTTMADLSHGIIRLLEHARERIDWMDVPISGDNIARQRAGITGPSLLFSTYWEEEDDA
jgi:hypothetical protein